MELPEATLRALELHEANAHAHGGRIVRDMGDAIFLTDPDEADPFLNRLSGLRLADGADCERRLAELYALFATSGRRPHAWVWPGVSTPEDLGRRLLADGFVDLGRTYAMALVGRPAPVPVPGGAQVEHSTTAGARRPAVLAGAAQVMVEAFGAMAGSAEHVAADLARAPSPDWDVCLVSRDDEPIAAGRRYTAAGMTHLSSIATRPGWWGGGYAAAVTAVLAGDGWAAGGTLVHLGVEAENARAQRLYRRLGFTNLGTGILDLLL